MIRVQNGKIMGFVTQNDLRRSHTPTLPEQTLDTASIQRKARVDL